MKKRSLVPSFKVQNKAKQPAIASGATIQTSGVRNGRSTFDAVQRSTITEIATAINAASVPALASAAISPSVSKPASAEHTIAVKIVMITGVPSFECTRPHERGSKPSRDIT